MGRTWERIKWLPEEDLWCINVFIENYFKRLIETGQPLLSDERQLEVNKYMKHFNNKRTNSSVIYKFHNVEHLAFKLVEQKGNPYDVPILKRLKNCSQQQRRVWAQQTAIYAEKINEWFNIS